MSSFAAWDVEFEQHEPSGVWLWRVPELGLCGGGATTLQPAARDMAEAVQGALESDG